MVQNVRKNPKTDRLTFDAFCTGFFSRACLVDFADHAVRHFGEVPVLRCRDNYEGFLTVVFKAFFVEAACLAYQ